MKKIIILSAAALVALSSCSNRNQQKRTAKESVRTEQSATTHNSRNSLDYDGTYKGTIPCADCSGIEVEITLKKDGSYAKTMTYLGKETNSVFRSEGTYTWDETGSKITLNGEKDSDIYKVGENKLTMLDGNGDPVTGDLADLYILKKK